MDLLERRHLGRGISLRSGAVTFSTYGPSERLASHEHGKAHICLLLSGSYLQASSGKEVVLKAGELGLYPEGHRHGNLLGDEGSCCLNFDIPDHLKPQDFKRMPVDPYLRIEAARLAAKVVLQEEPDPLSLECFIAELSVFNDGLEKPASFPMKKLLDLLDADPAASLIRLSEGIDRHPTHVARVFRNASGMSLGAYRRRIRASGLCLDLATEGASLSELAARHGYSDQAHMSREFKQFSGRSPGQWRASR